MICLLNLLLNKLLYFIYPKSRPSNNQENIPYQPVLWRVYDKIINKNSNIFYIETAKSIPHHDLVLNYGQTL